jgi:predicted DNA-binding protein (MmcQ/YjbR family)
MRSAAAASRRPCRSEAELRHEVAPDVGPRGMLIFRAMSLLPLDPDSLAGRLRTRALTFPEATEDFPWGERAIKVRGKAFLFLRAEGAAVSFSVKLPTSAADALELPDVEPTGYGLGKHGWVTAVVVAGRDTPLATFEAWLEESYAAVAPRRLVAQRAAQR